MLSDLWGEHDGALVAFPARTFPGDFGLPGRGGGACSSLQGVDVPPLTCLSQCQEKCQEARQSLSAIYGWFTEGFDTPDLQEASALLDQLCTDQDGQVTV